MDRLGETISSGTVLVPLVFNPISAKLAEAAGFPGAISWRRFHSGQVGSIQLPDACRAAPFEVTGEGVGLDGWYKQFQWLKLDRSPWQKGNAEMNAHRRQRARCLRHPEHAATPTELALMIATSINGMHNLSGNYPESEGNLAGTGLGSRVCRDHTRERMSGYQLAWHNRKHAMTRFMFLLASTFSFLAIGTVGFGGTPDPIGQFNPILSKEALKAESVSTNVSLAQAKLDSLKEISPAKEVNLLAPDQGGQALVVPNDEWFKPISGKEEDIATVYVGQEAVYAFKGEKPATFSKFSVLIVGEDGNNPKQMELLTGDESPTASFQSIGKLDIVNAKIVKSPYQEASFPQTTAKYFKIKILAGYGYPLHLRQIRLLGRQLE
jgi:hypothetical protein